jgi:endonuclease/exonuclease/phosphatase family metal-dependent hydrolase
MKKSTQVTIVSLIFVASIFIFSVSSSKQKAIVAGDYTRDERASALNLDSTSSSTCPHLFVSWNLANFGRSKSPESIEVMANVLKDADIVAIQEVNAGKDYGAQTVAQLAEALSRKGASWDYVVSNPTRPSTPGVERYGYLTKKNHVTFSRDQAHLVSELEDVIDREPFALTASLVHADAIQFFTIHTVPTKKGPAREVEALTGSNEVKNAPRAIFAGDLNLPAGVTDTYFEQMKYKGAIREKTSLKEKLDKVGGYLFHQYDNVYVKGITVCESGAIDFVGKYFAPVTDESLHKARKVSDHLPVYIRFK